MSEYNYESLVEILRKKSESLPTGTRLPSVRSLMKRYGLALPAVNAALNQLEKEGFMERRQRSGLYTRKNIKARYIEFHSALFSHSNYKEVSISEAMTAEGWHVEIRRHNAACDDPMEKPDAAADAHVVFSEFVNRDRLIFNLMLQQKVPIVVIGRQEDASLDTVAGRTHTLVGPLVNHLAGLGHRNIALLLSEPDGFDIRERQRAFAEVLSIFGLPHPLLIDCQTRPGEFSGVKAYTAMKNFLATIPKGKKLPFTAVVAMAPPGAIGGMRALHEAGISIPGQCSVGSITIAPENALSIPSITGSGIVMDEWGKAVVEILKRRFDGDKSDPICLDLETQFDAGESTGPALV